MTWEKHGGFYATRKAEERRRSHYWRRWLWLLALVALLLIAGLTPAWPQSSGSSLSSSANDLRTWEQLSGQFLSSLTGQSEQLRQALTELEASKVNSLKLTPLLEQSLKANDSLKNYNAQLAERMQTRDEEIAAAYDDINRLEKTVLKLVIAVIAMGAVIIIAVLLRIFLKI